MGGHGGPGTGVLAALGVAAGALVHALSAALGLTLVLIGLAVRLVAAPE